MDDTDRLRQLEQLVRAHQARLRSYVYSRTGSAETADDLVQEVFLVAFERLDRFDPSRPAGPWLWGIARNELREHWRAVERTSSAARLEALAAARQLRQDETAPPESALSDRLGDLRACLEKLPPRSRDLVRLLYTEHLSCEQVAERWREGATLVRVAIHRIRRALRKCVETRGIGEAP
jgi:RNA polymerase sigma-70 factor (ECF subfamily)